MEAPVRRFGPEIVFIKGSKNVVADVINRLLKKETRWMI